MPEAYFDSKPNKADVEPGKIAMPSWENFSTTLTSLLVPGKKKERPELFSATREAKCMPRDEMGRKSVGLISSHQLKGHVEEDIVRDLFPDASEFGHAKNDVDTDMQPVVNMLLKERPDPPPTYSNMTARAERNRYDYIGSLKPDPPKVGKELDVNDWLKHSVFSVQATGGKLRYPPRKEPYRPEQPSLLANSIFVSQPSWQPPPVRRTQKAQEEDFDLNSWIRKSIFYDDPKLKSEKRKQEEQEERQLRMRLRQNEEERERIRTVRFEESARRNVEAEIRSMTRQQIMAQSQHQAPPASQYISPPPARAASSPFRLQYQPSQPSQAQLPAPTQLARIPSSQGRTSLHAGAMVVEDFVNSDTDVHVSAVNETPVVIKNCSAMMGSVARIFLHGACRGVLVQGCKNVAVCVDQIYESCLVENSSDVYLGTGAALPPSTQIKDAPRTTLYAPKDTATTTLQLVRSAPATLLLAPAQPRPFTPEQILSGKNCFEVPLHQDGVQRLQNGQMVDVLNSRRSMNSSASLGMSEPVVQRPLVQGSHKAVKIIVVLDEDYDQVVGDRDMQNLFRDQFLREIASSCHANPRRFDIKSVSRGSIVIELIVLSDANDNRTPTQLAAQLVAMARDPGSMLRGQRTFQQLVRMDCADLEAAGVQSISNLSPKTGSKAGIGIMMDVTNAEGIPIVLEVNRGGPADMSGMINQGDRVIQIDGKPTLGMGKEDLVHAVSGLPGSVVRLKLRDPAGAEKMVTLTRRVAPINQKLADAASMIADSFKSPAYKNRKGSMSTQLDITNFQDTYTKKAIPMQQLPPAPPQPALSPVEDRTFSTVGSGSPSFNAGAVATIEDRSQSLTAPQHLAVAPTPVQSVMMQEQQSPPQYSPPQAQQSPSLSERQAIAETNLRAELARAQRQAETQQLQAMQAAQAQPPTRAANIPDVPPPPAVSQPRMQPQPSPQPPQQQAPKRQVQHKYSAITPARPPPVGTPKVVATVVAANNLPVTEKFGLCNPYVIMAIGSSFHKTTVKQSTLDPQWDETYEFPVQPSMLQGMLLTLTVEDHSAALRDEPIGQLSIPLLQLMVRKEWSGAFDLRAMKGTNSDASPCAVQLRLRYDPGNEG